MEFTIAFIIGALVFFASLFTGGKSMADVRAMFYGKYYAEDGLVDLEDKPNSPEAFQKCIDNNIGIKTEIMLTNDRRVVVSAYGDLSKEYGVDKKVSESDLEELEQLGVMSLTSLLELVDGKVPLILELKVGPNNDVLCRATADAIIASEKKNIAVCSFHSGVVGWFRHSAKEIFRGIVSAPAKEFKSLSKFDRWMTGNLGNNANCRPNFMLYRNRPHSIFVKFAIMSGILNGVWTIDDAEEGKRLEKEKEMIVVRGYMPETVHFKDMPVVEKTEQQIAAEKKMEEKAAKRRAKMEEKQQTVIRERSIAEILADDDELEENDNFVDEIKEEINEIVVEVKEEAGEIIQEVKEELTEIREKIITEE